MAIRNLRRTNANQEYADIFLNGNKLKLDVDDDSYIWSGADDEIQLVVAGSEIVEFDATSINFANTRFHLGGTIASGGIQGFLIEPTVTTTGGGISMFRVGGTHIPAAGETAYGSSFGTVITEAGSGTHPDLVGVNISALNITAAGGTTTNGTTLKIDGAPTEATNNYALWVADGDVQLDSPLTIGGTHSIGARQAVRINGTYTTTGGGYSVFTSGGTLIPANGETAYAAVFNTTIEEGSSGTHGDFVGLYVPTLDITADAGGTITNAATFKIGGAPTEATNNYAVHVDAGQVKIATTTASTSPTTGALVVAGGLGVADDIFAGTDVTAGERMAWGGDAAQSTARAKTNNKQDLGTTREEILDTASISGGMGGMAIVCGKKVGDDNTNFVDIILFGDATGSTVTTVSSANVQGSPDDREYDMNNERKVRCGVGGNSYNINVIGFGIGDPT